METTPKTKILTLQEIKARKAKANMEAENKQTV